MLKSIKWTSGIISHEMPTVTFSGYNTEHTTRESSVGVTLNIQQENLLLM